jgi:hypothetical protein
VRVSSVARMARMDAWPMAIGVASSACAPVGGT